MVWIIIQLKETKKLKLIKFKQQECDRRDKKHVQFTDFGVSRTDAFMKTRHAAVIFQLQYLYCLFTEHNSIDLFYKIIKILLLVLFCVVCVGALNKLIVPPSKA